MASTYSPLKIELIGTGEQVGTWGSTTNTNLGTAIEQAIGGKADITMSSTSQTLTLTNTNAAQNARALYLNLTGTPGGAATLNVPAVEKAYIVRNGTNQTVTVKVTGQTGVAVPTGKTMHLYNNGTDVVNAVDNLPSGATVGGVAIGTGAGSVTSVSGTGTVQGLTLTGNVTSTGNLTLGGSLSAVNLASQVTGTLPIANGGTGATTSTAATNALLPSQSGNSGRYLTTNGTNTSWGTVAAGGVTSVSASSPLASSGGATPNISFTGVLGATNGGTAQSTYTTGDLIYASGTNTLAKRAVGTTGQVLTVSGGVPAWSTLTAGDVTGPASTGSSAIVLFDGTTGKLIKSSDSADGFIHGIRIGRGPGNQQTNTLVGSNSFISNTTGQYNTVVGRNAAASNLSASYNTAIGFQTLYSNVGAQYNTAVGYLSMFTHGSLGGNYNTAIGASSLYSSTDAVDNTAVGYAALDSTTGGSQNVAVGSRALDANTTGGGNTAVGAYALDANTTSSQLTAVGTQALGLSTGAGNTALGYQALSGLLTQTNCTGLGKNASISASNQVQLGDSATTTYAYGAVQDRSDARDKADIRDTQLGLSFISALRPVDFKWDYREDYRPSIPNKEDFESDEAFEQAMQQWVESSDFSNITHDGTHKRGRYHHGLIAQEVKAVLDAQGIDFGGYQDHSVKGGQDVLSIGYNELIAPMVKAIQELTARLEAAEAEIVTLKG